MAYKIGRFSRKEYKSARDVLLNENPLLSIIVPGKNEGEHIYKLVKSLQEQTYQNIEIIIIDDGSDDNTEIICQSLLKNGLIDIFLRNEVRGGKASAANFGLRYTKGKFIIHLDADCSLDYNAIENIIIPFYSDPKIGAVGGNLKVRNYNASLCTSLQAIEYLKSISIGRIATSFFGTYDIISGAFGAFRKDVLDRVGGWDVGPGLDGDLTIKVRKMGFKVVFQPEAILLTNAPVSFKVLTKQRLRWNKSIIRFRLRKHIDVIFPNQNFRLSNFLSFADKIFYNIILDIFAYLYLVDNLISQNSVLGYVIIVNYFLSLVSNFLKFGIILSFSERRKDEWKLWVYLFAMPIYMAFYMRAVRTYAYIKEFFFKSSYNDVWNPRKSSMQAKIHRL